MRSLFVASYIALFIGMAFPPLLIVGVLLFTLAMTSLRRSVREIRATEQAAINKQRTRDHDAAVRFFA